METSQNSTYQRTLEITWLALIFLLPVAFNPYSYQIFSIPKASLFHFLVLVMLGCHIAHWLWQRPQPSQSRHLSLSPLHLSVLAFGLLAAAATVASITPAASFWGTWERKAGLLTLMCWIAFFFILTYHLRTRAQLFRALYALLLSSGIVSLVGIFQYFFPDAAYAVFHCTHGGRVFATVGNPLFLSGFLAAVIPINLAVIISSWHRWRQHRQDAATRFILPACLLLLLALQFWCLWLAQYSVTILLYLIASIVFVALLGIIKRSRLILGIGAASLLALVIVAAVLLAPMLLPLSTTSSTEPSTPQTATAAEKLGLNTLDIRARYWHSSIDILVKSPQIPFSHDRLHSLRRYIGYGPETFKVPFQLFFPEGLKSSFTHKSILVDHPHNHYLYIAITMGLLGLAAFLWLLALFFYLCSRYLQRTAHSSHKLLLAAFLAAIIQYLADMLFNPSTICPELMFWLPLSLTMVIGRLAASPETTPPQSQMTAPPHSLTEKTSRLRRNLALLCLLAVTLIGAGIAARPLAACMYLEQGFKLQAKGSDRAVFAFSRAVKLEPGEPAYWYYLGAYATSVARRTAAEPLKTEVLTLATTALDRARQLSPYVAFQHYRLADVYTYWAGEGAADKWTQALSLYDRASQLFPDNAVILNKWALALVIKGDLNEARAKLDHSASVDPQWSQTSFLMGLLLAVEGNDTEAAATIMAPIAEEPASLSYFVDLCQHLAFYDMAGLLQRALEVQTQAQPGAWSSHALLGIASLAAGNLDNSLAELDTAMLLAPPQDVAHLFTAILKLSRISSGFRAALPDIAAGWRDSLAQSPQRDTLLPRLERLLGKP